MGRSAAIRPAGGSLGHAETDEKASGTKLYLFSAYLKEGFSSICRVFEGVSESERWAANFRMIEHARATQEQTHKTIEAHKRERYNQIISISQQPTANTEEQRYKHRFGMKNLRHIISIVYLVSAVHLGSVWADGGGKGSIRGKSEDERELQPSTNEKIIDHPQNGIEGEWIVILDDDIGRDDVNPSLDRLLRDLPNGRRSGNGWAIGRNRGLRGGLITNLNRAQAIVLSHKSGVRYVEQNGIVEAFQTPPPQSPVPSWGLDRIDQRNLPIDGSFDYGNGGYGANIYIIDSGVDKEAENDDGIQEFVGRIEPGPDFIDNDSDPTDCDGHGTHGE